MGSAKERLKNVTHKVAAPEVVKYWVQHRKRIGAHLLAKSCAVMRMSPDSPVRSLSVHVMSFPKDAGG